MKFYLLLVYVTVALVAFYYLTVFLHIFFGIFGENVKENRVFIPFYGWIKGIKNDKQKEEEAEAAALSAIAEQNKKTKKKTKTVKKKKAETPDDKNDNE